jgi:hypothetical protein
LIGILWSYEFGDSWIVDWGVQVGVQREKGKFVREGVREAASGGS